jgi:Tfp pilus assembly protein PilN
MGPIKPMDLKKILAVGTGVSIEIGDRDLRVAVVRVRPFGITILGTTTIAGFRHRPAAEWGAEYAQFLKKLGGSHLAATVLLPRREVIVRQISLPGVKDRDLGAAVEYQIDSLHPYAEEEAHYSFARLGNTPAVLIGIARGPVIERYATLFGEAGIKVATFTFSAVALYSALRLFGTPPSGGFLAITASDGEMEVYGESPARPAFSAVFDASPDRTPSLAAAELRLPPDSEALTLAQVLPGPKQKPEDYDLSRAALPYATALAGACPWLALKANLLPPQYRSTSSRAMFVPTFALIAVLLILVAALAVQAGYEERQYLAVLEAEIARLEPQARKVVELDRSVEQERARIRLLDEFRRRTKADLDVLNELTGLLKPPTWLNSVDLARDSVSIGGEAEQAAALVKLLDNSPLFRNSEFAIPIARTGKTELFRIRTLRERATP